MLYHATGHAELFRMVTNLTFAVLNYDLIVINTKSKADKFYISII